MSDSPPSWMDKKRMEAVEKVVLQRAKISRITRQLQNRLALASYKTKRGWENLNLDAIEPRIAEEAASRRSSSSQLGQVNEAAITSFSSPIKSSNGNFSLPPLPSRHPKATIQPSSARKQYRMNGNSISRKRARTLSHETKTAMGQYMPWKSATQDDEDDDQEMINGYHQSPQYSNGLRLSQSSPVYPGIASGNMTRYPPTFDHHREPTRVGLPPPPPQKQSNGSPSKSRHSRTQSQNGHSARQHRKNKSSVNSIASTMSAMSSASTTSMGGGPTYRRSPPHTPPHRSHLMNEKTPYQRTGEEGADLLMFLATSPSPAQRSSFAKQQHPSLMSTPPLHQRGSSSIHTPPLISSNVGPPQTPSQGFNFSDYVNNIFTPSPAQAQWSRTPIVTPARRRLNFDQVPGSEGSAVVNSNAPVNGSFTAMEVGPSLMP